jgi:hypothetical protein
MKQRATWRRWWAVGLAAGLAAGIAASWGGVAQAERSLPGWEVPEEHVQAALAEAGANRPQLEKVLAHFAQVGGESTRPLEAARFLIANMPGKGYVVTALKTADGQVIEYDPLAHPSYEQALQAYEVLERKHGKIDFARDRLVSDLTTLKAEFLIEHIEQALAAWQATPDARRVHFGTFREHILPYRGSEEPAEGWMRAMRERFGEKPEGVGDLADPEQVWRFVNEDVGARIAFNERYYLHPTDQGFAEMSRTKQGRCEDITNLTTYAARALGLATAADYTPAWGHRDNNHAWNVLLDRHGLGSDRAQAHAAKVYRKTFAIQRGNLAFLLPEGREAPNRFLGSKSYVDVTDQYGATTDVRVVLDPARAWEERFAYLCVFNGGEWTAIHWAAPGRVRDGALAVFTNMGRGAGGMLYLPAVHDGKALKAAAAPILLRHDGSVDVLRGTGRTLDLVATAVSPPQRSPDTHETKPTMHLEPGVTYVLSRWTLDGWVEVGSAEAKTDPLVFPEQPVDGLYWLRPRESRRLERPFTIEGGRQRFW